MISNRLPPTIKSKEEEDDEQLSSLILEPKRVRSILKTLLTNTEIHRNLWHLSFVDCSLNEDILLPLSQFASMGLLDFSFTNIDVLTLQRIIRPIRCLRLHLFQCQQLKISSADDKLYGFVLFSLPGVWSLNGILTLTEDRNKWTHYYLHGKGKFSDLIRKGQFVKFDSTPSPVGKIVTGKPLMSKGAGSPAGVPFILNKSLGRNNTRSNDGTSTTSNSNSRSGGEIRVGWIWNKWSYSLLSRMPVGFRMGGEESTWKLGKLCAELDRAVQQSLKVSSPSTSLISLNNIISLSSEVKIVLSHLVWASLLSDFPMILLQKSLEFILLGSSTSLSSTATTTDNLNWLKHPTSPLLWPRNLRMLFLTIMMASMKMDMSAEIHGDQTTCSVHLSLDSLQAFKSSIQVLYEMHYDHLMKHASTNQQAIDVEIPHILFEPKLKDVLRSFVKTQDIAVLDIYFLCRNILEIIQFCTLAPEDVLFLHAFPKLESLFKLAMDGILSMSIFRKVAASASLAVKKKSATRQGSSSVSLFASGDNGESENGGGGNNGSSSSSQEEFFRIKQHYTRILTDHEEQMSSNNNGSGDDFIKSILLSANNTAAVGELASKLGSNTFLNNHNNDDDCGSVTSSSTASAALMTARDGRNSTRSNNISKPTVEGLSLDLKFRFCFHIQRFLEWSDGIVNGLSEAREMEAHMGRVSSIRIN